MAFTSWSSSSGDSTGYGNADAGSPALASLLPAGLTEAEKGIAWFMMVFGGGYVMLGAIALARFFYVRHVFEIRARSPYLVMLNGSMLLAVVGLYAYTAEYQLFGNFPLDFEDLYIVAFFVTWTMFSCFWARVVRLGLSYSPRLRRKLPWLMSERLLICLSLLFGLAGTIQPLYRAHTINGPLAIWIFVEKNEDDRFIWSWILLGASISLIPIVWRVDDIFTISKELLAFIIVQSCMTAGVQVTDKYASVETAYWVNKETIPFVGALILFGLIIVDPLRRLAFNPLSKTYPALSRAHSTRREAALRALRKHDLSEMTEATSFNDSGSASASDLATPRKRKWNYERLAANPGMAEAFRGFAFRALCQESVLFLEEVSKYQEGEFCASPAEEQSQKNAFCAIVARFIVDGSTDEVNISYSDKRKILDLSRGDAEKFEDLDWGEKRAVFGEAYVEVRYMLESNLLQRFTETDEFKEQEQKTPPPVPCRRRQRRGNNFSDNDEFNLMMHYDLEEQERPRSLLPGAGDFRPGQQLPALHS